MALYDRPEDTYTSHYGQPIRGYTNGSPYITPSGPVGGLASGLWGAQAGVVDPFNPTEEEARKMMAAYARQNMLPPELNPGAFGVDQAGVDAYTGRQKQLEAERLQGQNYTPLHVGNPNITGYLNNMATGGAFGSQALSQIAANRQQNIGNQLALARSVSGDALAHVAARRRAQENINNIGSQSTMQADMMMHQQRQQAQQLAAQLAAVQANNEMQQRKNAVQANQGYLGALQAREGAQLGRSQAYAETEGNLAQQEYARQRGVQANIADRTQRMVGAGVGAVGTALAGYLSRQKKNEDDYNG